MDLETIREHCLKKKGVTESFPFNEEVLVYKVMNKMFLLTNINLPFTINVKCDPELASELRERYPEVTGAWHMNKTHWNTIDLTGTVPEKRIREWIKDSYWLVSEGLSLKDRKELRER